MAELFLHSPQTHILLLPLLLLPLLYFIISKHLIKKPRNPPLPPGPTPCPFLATIHLLKPLTHVSLAQLSQTYGPLISLKLGMETLVVASSPAAAVEILKTNDRTFSARTVPHAVPLTASEIERLSFWGDALSDHLKNVRAICRAELFSAKSLEAQRRLWQEKVAEMVGSLRTKEGAAVDLGRVVFATVVNVFGNVLFSEDIVGVEEERCCNEVRGFLRGIIQAISAPNLADFYPLFVGKFDPHGLRKKHRESSERMWGLWERVVRERRRSAEAELKNRDFLDALISRGFTDEEINKLFEELLTAGIDTTTSTINRTMLELLSSPESMIKLQQELHSVLNQDSLTDFPLEQLPYLQACVKETLRLHPPAALLLAHRARETCLVMNYTVPRDARVLVNVWAIGRDPTVWEEPVEYRPERFLNSTRDFKGNDFELLPFGAGRRICPGLPMAAKIVPFLLAWLVYSFDWSLLDATVDETFRATSQMVQPLLLIPRARKMSPE